MYIKCELVSFLEIFFIVFFVYGYVLSAQEVDNHFFIVSYYIKWATTSWT